MPSRIGKARRSAGQARASGRCCASRSTAAGPCRSGRRAGRAGGGPCQWCSAAPKPADGPAVEVGQRANRERGRFHVSGARPPEATDGPSGRSECERGGSCVAAARPLTAPRPANAASGSCRGARPPEATDGPLGGQRANASVGVSCQVQRQGRCCSTLASSAGGSRKSSPTTHTRVLPTAAGASLAASFSVQTTSGVPAARAGVDRSAWSGRGSGVQARPASASMPKNRCGAAMPAMASRGRPRSACSACSCIAPPACQCARGKAPDRERKASSPASGVLGAAAL